MRTLQRLGVIICLWTFGLMMLGGYVKAIHAGLACPDWPTCYGQWLPPFEDPDGFYSTHMIMAEWVHRLVAILLGPLLLGFTWMTFRRKDAHPVIRYTPAAAIGVLFLQIILGGLTVTEGLQPVIVTSHLGGATVFFGLMVMTTVMLYAHPLAEPAAASATTRTGRGGQPRRVDGVWRDPISGATGNAPGTKPFQPPTQHPPRPQQETASLNPYAGRSAWAIVSDYVSMTKPRVMFLLVLTSLTAMFLAADGIPPFWPALGVVIGGAMATGASGSINHFLEREVDTRMERTRDRPVASGRIPARHAIAFGVSLAILSFFATWHFANLLAAFFVMCGLVFYVLIYTMWLKQTTSLNIVIGGAAGGFPALVGWAAVDGSVGLAAWLFFLLVVVWTPPHFWALALVLKDDYGRAGIPMLPSVKGVPRTTLEIMVYSVVTVLLSFGFYFLDVLGRLYLIAAALLGGLFLVLALQLRLEPSKTSARRMFGYSIIYLGLLYVAAFVDLALA